METDGYLSIGKIVGVHGVKGTLRVYSYAESPSIFQPGIRILLKNDTGFKKRYPVCGVKSHTKGLLLSVDGIHDRDAAAMLIGCEIFIEKSHLPELEEGAYYWSDIIGLAVYDTDDAYLGRVTSVVPTGGNDVYVVRNKDQEVLVPALEWVVLRIDLAAGRMIVNLPEGL